jgi:uncharacterized short protein YbdD (DUF466 family)
MRKIMNFAKQAKASIKIIFNIPDYERYLKHHQEYHPGEKVLTEKEFYMACLKERYESGKINRCC